MKISFSEIRDSLYRIIEAIPLVQKMGRRRVEMILLGIGAVVVVSILLSLGATGAGSTQASWAVVQKGTFVVDLVESGDVEAVSQFLISAPMMWGAQLKVIDVVAEGSIVKKDDVILQFDVSDLEDEKKIREDRLESLYADMEKLKAQQALTISNQESSLRLAEYSYEQAQLLLKMREFESQARQEEARLQLKQAEIELAKVQKQLESQRIIHASQLVRMRTQIREAQNRVESIVDRISRLQLRAPADGMIVYQQVDGERVKEGFEARPGWPLMSIPNLSHLQIKLFVNEVDRQKVGVGQRAEIVLDAYPEKMFHGAIREVSRLAQKVIGEERLKGFVVYVDVEGSAPELKPGLTAKVRIVLEKQEDALFAPVSAVFEIEGQPVVFPADKSKPYAVYLGPRNDGYVVVERGLEAGMKLTRAPADASASALGTKEERRRIDALAQTVRESFDVFEERGILFDYGTSEMDSSQEEAPQPAVDMEELPPFLRERLKGQGKDQGGEKPKVEVGDPDAEKKGTFRVSPDMMKRLEKKDEQKEESTPPQEE